MDLLNLGALGAGGDELADQFRRIAPCDSSPKRPLADPVLFGVVMAAKTDSVPIIRLLPGASAAPQANMRHLDWTIIAGYDAATMRPHEIAMRL